MESLSFNKYSTKIFTDPIYADYSSKWKHWPRFATKTGDAPTIIPGNLERTDHMNPKYPMA
jgi:hypothetical protein